MNLLELLVLCVSIYISFAGSPTYIPLSSFIDESSLQSVVSTGPWITETASSSQTHYSSFVDEESSELISSSGSLISEAILSSQILNDSVRDDSSSQLIASSSTAPSSQVTSTSFFDMNSSQLTISSNNISSSSQISESSSHQIPSSDISNAELATMISIPSSSSANESSTQSIEPSNSSGTWLYDTVDTRPSCITCYVLFKTNQNTTRKCNPNHKFIWELWYNVSGVQRGGYCIEFESLKNIEEINPQITSVIATSVPTTSSGNVSTVGGGFGGGSTTIYQWSKGQEMTVKTSVLPDCVPCYDFLHIFPKLSPFECDPGNNMKVKVTYEVFRGMEETGYCAGQITMSDRELRNIQKLFWTEKTEEPKCVDCYDVLALGKNASKEYCDSGNERIWHVQYYKQNWSLAMDGYCVNKYYYSTYYNAMYYWKMMDEILFAQVYRLDLSGYYNWMRSDATEIEMSTCKPCANIIYLHNNVIDECQSNGHPLWQVWFNTTNGESYGGYCIDFMLIDLGLLADKYITYIQAFNETISYEWFSSGSELKQVTDPYPSCVNCSDLNNANTYLSSFYCDPRNQTKIKVDFTTVADKKIRGYCSGFFYNYTVGKTQYKPTHIEMYDIFNTYSWNERCADCYDVFMLGSRISRQDCDAGNETLWRAYYVKEQYYISYNPEFLVDGFCINFTLSNFDTWEFPVDTSYAYVHTLSDYKSDYWYRQDCVSCFDALVNGYSLSYKRCITGGEPRWNVSFTFSYYNYPGEGFCLGLSPDSLDSWNIREGMQSIIAKNGNETYSWHRPTPSPVECISCYDALVYGSSLSYENCYGGSEQRWEIEIYYTYYYHYYYQRSFGYCKGLDSDSFNIWSINDGIQSINANSGTENYYYYKSYPSLSSSSETYSDFSSYTSEPLRCLSCYEILLYRSSYNPNCDPQGQTLWDMWFNSTDAFTDGGFCVDFLETDFTGIGDSITYIRASNESSTIEWFKSDPIIKKITETFPACVSCSDVASSDIEFSPFDCDPGYRYKVRARYTNSLGEDSIGYCVGVGSYDFSSKNITHVTLYDRFGTYNMVNSGFAT